MTTSEFCTSRGVASGSSYACRKDEVLHGKYSKNLKFVKIKSEAPALISPVEAAAKIPVVPIFASIRLGAFQLDIHQQIDAEYLCELLIGETMHIPTAKKYFVYPECIDSRKSFNGLSSMLKCKNLISVFQLSPNNNIVFCTLILRSNEKLRNVSDNYN